MLKYLVHTMVYRAELCSCCPFQQTEQDPSSLSGLRIDQCLALSPTHTRNLGQKPHALPNSSARGVRFLRGNMHLAKILVLEVRSGFITYQLVT